MGTKRAEAHMAEAWKLSAAVDGFGHRVTWEPLWVVEGFGFTI